MLGIHLSRNPINQLHRKLLGPVNIFDNEKKRTNLLKQIDCDTIMPNSQPIFNVFLQELNLQDFKTSHKRH